MPQESKHSSHNRIFMEPIKPYMGSYVSLRKFFINTFSLRWSLKFINYLQSLHWYQKFKHNFLNVFQSKAVCNLSHCISKYPAMWHSNFLSPFTKRYLKTLFHSELYKHTNKYIFCDIKILFYGCESFFWALIEIKISLTDVLTHLLCHQISVWNMSRYDKIPLFSNYDKHAFWWKNKSKAIITVF